MIVHPDSGLPADRVIIVGANGEVIDLTPQPGLSEAAVNLLIDSRVEDYGIVAEDGALSITSEDGLTVNGSLVELSSNKDPDVTLAADSDVRYPTQRAVRAYVGQIVAANDAMVFKGVVDASANPSYPAADRGHTYRVSVSGRVGGGSGSVVEAGDVLICLDDNTPSGDQAAQGAHWTVVQANVDGAVAGPTSATDGHLAQFDGSSGRLLKDGLALDVDTTLAANSDTRLGSQKAVKAYADTKLGGTAAAGGDLGGNYPNPTVTKVGGVEVTVDTDGTLAPNSDAKLATQKAVKAYADTKLGGTASAGGDLSGSYPNPNVAKLGGVSVTVDTDPTLAANSDAKLPTQKAVKAYADAHAYTASYSFYDPAKPFASPSALDDHFNSASLAAKWNQVNWATMTAYDLHTTKPGAVWTKVQSQSSGAGELFRALMQTLPAGDFSAFCQLSFAARKIALYKAGIMVADGVTAGAGNQAWFGFKYNSDYVICAERDTNYNAGAAALGSDLAITLFPSMFIRVRRVSTTYYWSMSADGATWHLEQSTSLPFTPAYVGFALNNYNNGQAVEASLDFFFFSTDPNALLGGLRSV